MCRKAAPARIAATQPTTNSTELGTATATTLGAAGSSVAPMRVAMRSTASRSSPYVMDSPEPARAGSSGVAAHWSRIRV